MSIIEREICINITRRCNLHCSGCYVSDFLFIKNNNGGIDISLSEIKAILDLSTFDVVYLTGGEPFTHPEIKAIIEYFYYNGKIINIATNGLMISEELCHFLSGKGISLLISLRDEYFDEVCKIVNYLTPFDIDVICYHLPTCNSPRILTDFSNLCTSVNKIKLLYDSKNSPSAVEWFSLLIKIYTETFFRPGMEITVEIGFLPRDNKYALEERRGAIDRIQISTEGKFYSCPLLVLNEKGSIQPPPPKCSRDTCPVLSKELDSEQLASVCCFLESTLNDAILVARWAGIDYNSILDCTMEEDAD